ncbi:Hint domain-containing protein [Ancylobacter sp. Lp-2]|uniref:Hint domain-containing protein n=1 Tax=Ancylobacter sp. Lp-2 TaxID=2881339 RepID=UPI001E5FF989|nr:Hint domain-containing protein [Ancylobacter sp. Lp-2]MCB4769028.1 Hint domain-containing protein [Ancylobacter sp. Lp-2]
MADYSIIGSYKVTFSSGTPSTITTIQTFAPNPTTATDNTTDDAFSVGEFIYYSGDPFGTGYFDVYIGYTPYGFITELAGDYYLNTDNPSLALGTVLSVTEQDLIVCFLAGTRIATPAGEAAIDTLAAGDLVLTHEGTAKPVRWLARQTVATVFADPSRAMPILVRAGALGEGLPMRDLEVSPDHALLVDGTLVQAAALVNGTSIRRRSAMPPTFTYYHVELDDQSLILAEGVPAETFVDNVTRRRFDNWQEAPEASVAELDLPRVKSARQLPPALRTRLAERARLIGSDAPEGTAAA